MTALNFPAALAFTLASEGGWNDDPRDRGGPTMKGITFASFLAYYPSATLDDLRTITDDEVENIYRYYYWARVRGDDLPAGVDLSIFDFGVNAGPDRSIRLLQDTIHVAPDGILGPISLAAITRANPITLISNLWARQRAYYEALPGFATFGRGWIARTSQRRAAALKLAGAKAA